MRSFGLIRMAGFRAAVIYACALYAIMNWPNALLQTLAPLTGAAADWSSPWLEAIGIQVEQGVMNVHGEIHIPMQLQDGTSLPAAAGNWRKHGRQTLNILLVALPIWAIPPMSWRNRVWSLLVVFVCVMILSAVDLVLQIQESALAFIGSEWLPALPLIPTEENFRIFQCLETRYRVVSSISNFLDSGGRLFLGALCGFASCFWSEWLAGDKQGARLSGAQRENVPGRAPEER